MKIQLISTKNIFLQFYPLGDDSEIDGNHENKDKFSFNLDVSFSEDHPMIFTVKIQAELAKKDQYLIQSIFVSEFTTDKPINDTFRASKFPYVNAPAIAYPFFRAFLANILSSSGWDVHYLPSVNFEKIYDDNNK